MHLPSKHYTRLKALMKNILSAVVLCAIVGFANPALASKELASSKNCLSCHAAEKKIIGPSIKAIAEKYASADAAKLEQLAKKVREGGVGVWGAIPMSANPQVSVPESESLVKWFVNGGK